MLYPNCNRPPAPHKWIPKILATLALFLSVPAPAAPITPSTQWGDVVPTNTLADVAKGAQLVSSNDLETALSNIPTASVGLTNDVLWVNGQHTNIIVKYSNGAVDLGIRTPNTLIGGNSTVVGTNNVARGYISYAEGNHTTASGDYSHAEGINTTASGYNSHAEGNHTTASGNYSHAEGEYTTASGIYSHAEGEDTVSGSWAAHAEGATTKALGFYAHAEGFATMANATGSHAAGLKSDAKSADYFSYVWQGGTSGGLSPGGNPFNPYYSHGPGTYNISPVGGTSGFYIGNTNFVDHVANIATNLIFPASLPVKRIAMFIVDVNYRTLGNTSTATNSTEMPYLGFELKASTNNFLGGSDSAGIQFYSHSDAADIGGGDPVTDKMKLYTCSNYGGDDFRSYKYIGSTLPTTWPHKLGKVVVLVDASCLVRNPGGDWLRDDNEDLIWCYIRNLNGSLEYEPGTDRQWWKPIAPVRWFSKMPQWAVSQDN